MKWQKMYFSEYPPMPQIKEWHSSNLNWQGETTMLIQNQNIKIFKLIRVFNHWTSPSHKHEGGGGKKLLPGMIN